MIVWLLALFIMTCTGIVGFYQGALRAAFSLIGLLVAALFASPVGALCKLVLTIFGLKNPLYLAFLGPIFGFILVLTIFKLVALAVHKKVDGWYKYKANDTQRLLFERMNARVGVAVGLANGFIYVLAIGTFIYSLGYLTMQVATSDQDSWALRLVNKLADDASSTGLNKAVAPFMTKSEFYYDATDVLADIFQTPLLQNRLANYPPFLLLSEKDEFKMLSDAGFQNEWIKGMTFGTFAHHDRVVPLIESDKTYTNIVGLLGGDVKDLKTYLETGKSPKYDEERILGRWAFDFRASMNAARKRTPNMGSAQITKLRNDMGTTFRNALLIATVDNNAILKLKDGKGTQGRWRTSGSSYVLSITENGKKLDLDVSVDGRTLIFTRGNMVLVFENTRV
jgi:hypothetical protein